MYANADFYLDCRQPEWLEAERAGRVKYSRNGLCVDIEDEPIASAITRANAERVRRIVG